MYLAKSNVLTGDRLLPSVLALILLPVEDRRVYICRCWRQSGSERSSLLSARLGTGPNIRRKISRSCDVAIVFDGGRGICVHGSLRRTMYVKIFVQAVLCALQSSNFQKQLPSSFYCEDARLPSN